MVLAYSGRLGDVNRYAWSFLNRYPNYFHSFDTFMNARTEQGYLILNLVIRLMSDNAMVLFFVIALLTTFINIYCIYNQNKDYTLLIFVYLISIYYFQTTYLLRQTIAVSFGNLAFLALLKKSNKKYILFTLLALSFHSTAIFLVPMYFFFKSNATNKYKLLFIIFILIFILFGPLSSALLPRIPYIDNFFDVENIELTLGGGTIESIFKGFPYYLISILAYYKRKDLNKIMSNADIYIICSMLYSASWLLTYNMYWVFRIGWYFLAPTLVLIPNLFKTFTTIKMKNIFIVSLYSSMIFITLRQIIITLY